MNFIQLPVLQGLTQEIGGGPTKQTLINLDLVETISALTGETCRLTFPSEEGPNHIFAAIAFDELVEKISVMGWSKRA